VRKRNEWQLVDGGITIVDDVVLRPARPQTPTVHALLRHLLDQGLTCVPEPIGIRNGVEALRHIPGDSGGDAWQHQVGDDGLRSAAVLLAEVHEAMRGWVPPDDAEWGVPALPGAGEICHGDPGPWNMVWDGPRAVALIDWDLAHPGPFLDDVAYALEYFAPFRSDEVACDPVDGHHFPAPPDRRARIACFASVYGLSSTTGLFDRVLARQAQTIEHAQLLAERHVQPQQAWVEEGHLDDLRGRLRWSREHRHLFE
jgi:Ser/Thr protein kinase RdoA (MazF antagonist)